MRDEGKKDIRQGKVNILIPMIIIFFLMVGMVLYTSNVIRRVAVANVHEVGEDRISNVTGDLESYLDTTLNTVWITADAVDFMVRNGRSVDEILEYIVEESERQKDHFDENYSGLYGYVKGEYLDGLGWVPPEGYDPTQRDWYIAALKANGDSTIVAPYLDAQTGNIIISICRMLSSGTDVVSLDVAMNHIQDIVVNLKIMEKGYGFVVAQDGMIVAHQDDSLKGSYLNETDSQRALLEKIQEVRDGHFEIDDHGQRNTVFVHQILGQWYSVIIVSNGELYAEVNQQLTVNVLISVVIFLLIGFFYMIGRRNEQNYSRKIEEMRTEEQRQAYEARALKLEKEAADRSNQAKSDFLAEMSHEIRTPINAVLGMNEIILRETQNARDTIPPEMVSVRNSVRQIRICSHNIENAGSSLLSIINDILDLSKIESGKMEITEGEYWLRDLLDGLSSMFFFRASEKGLQFIVNVDEKLPNHLYGDKVRVRQIFTNLLTNAVKYTNEGQVCLDVRGEILESEDAESILRLMVTVRDTGIGIREEDIDKLFTKFQRVDLKTNSTVEGTGLGLAITHSLLTMMGGSIRVESEYGAGSAFIITLPQKIVSMESIGSVKTSFERDTQDSVAYRELFHAPDARILIVDDTRMNLTVVTGLLKNTWIQVDTAISGRRAIELAGSNAYDLILMDQRMPEMDGTEAMRLIQAQENGLNRDTPVICLTADAIIGARERYLAEGFRDYLPKPIDSRNLEQMLLKYLPPEKVIHVQQRGSKVSHPGKAPREDEEENRYDSLKASGINPAAGLRFAQNDETLYGVLLNEYANTAEEKLPEIQRYFDAQDWKNYAILVHALKSTSRTIGAESLADLAEDIEHAAKTGDVNLIGKAHPRMIKLYEETVSSIREIISPAGEPGEDDEIMEFIP